MNYQLTEEQTMLLDSLRAFLEEEIYPYEAEADRSGEVDEDQGRRIKAKAIEMGFFAANLPESVGGGLDYTTMGIFERDLGKASYALAGHIARPTELLLACEGEQVEKYLAPKDLTAVTLEAAAMANVTLAGTDWIPGNNRYQVRPTNR